MIFKIQKPLFISKGKEYYLSYNQSKSLMFNDIEVGKFEGLDNMFKGNENKIYVEGYLDKQGRLRIKRRVENQEW